MLIYTTCSCGNPVLHLGRQGNVHEGCEDPEAWINALEDAFLAAACAGTEADADRLAAALDRTVIPPAPRLGAAALAYARWGWPVHPLLPGAKVPATPHGFHDATTDPEVITAWWRATPTANVGLATGHAFDVLDIDLHVPGTGRRWMDLDDSKVLPTGHGMVSTARGGLHLYLRPTGDGNTANMVGGIDFRGRGGYVVAPPSRLDDGRHWSWTVRPSPYISTQPDAVPPDE